MEHRRALVGACLGIVGTAFSPVLAANDVTFEQVIADPGNVELNMAFAKQRIAQGDLVAAAAALERLLFIEPDWDEARLMYAGVLYRLGDDEAAAREMSLLDGRALPDRAQPTADAFQRRIAHGAKKTKIGGLVSIGLGYDDQASALVTEEDVFQTIDDEQHSWIARGQLRFTHDLDTGQHVSVFGSVDGYLKQFEDDAVDGYHILNGRFGLTGRLPVFDWRTNFASRVIGIDGDEYLQEIGGEVSLSRNIATNTRLSLDANYFDQEYESVFSEFDLSSLRSGDRFDISARLHHAFTASFAGHASILHREKNVDSDDAFAQGLAYSANGVQIGADIQCGAGIYLDTDFFYRQFDYDGIDGREDDYQHARIAVGAPLSTLIPPMRGGADNWALEMAISQTDRDSSLNEFDYDNLGAELRLIWRFGQ